MTTKSPRDLLSGRELIGFKRRPEGDDQVLQRASSAKVTVEPNLPIKGTGLKPSKDKSGS